jgi:hypothetical protein
MRYVVRPRAETFDALRETPHLEGRTVLEPEPVDTGLVDKDGNRIWRVMSPIGFVELKERQ